MKGGRIGKGRAMIGSLLNIKPIATLQDGVYTPVGKARSHKQVVTHLFKAFTEETAGKIIRGVGISHANGLAMAEPLKKMFEDSGIKDVKLRLRRLSLVPIQVKVQSDSCTTQTNER